jgi:3-oxoacyl-[acyl-carrier protein] reductase
VVHEQTATKRVVLVTGASRGIGAETARQLGRSGAHVLVNFREKRKRAQNVVDEILAAGGTGSAIGADLSNLADASTMIDAIRENFGRLDALVLNASGGLERDADPGYAMRLNRDAQVSLAELALPLMSTGGRIVFVTSHQSHFYGHKPVPGEYEPIAASKRAGEDALRALIPKFDSCEVGFTVVSGDMIDGTIIVRLLERRDPAAVDSRRDHGPLPTIEEFAQTVTDATATSVPSGHTFYVGGQDYLRSAT